MRGSGDPQEVMLAVVNLEERVPKDHPLPLRINLASGSVLLRWVSFFNGHGGA